MSLQTYTGDMDTSLGDYTQDELVEETVNLLRRAKGGDDRADTLREVADRLVELRSRHYTKDGEPDWGGRSWPYRNLVAYIYANAGLDRDGQSSVKSNIRYHIGNALRDRVDSGSLEEVGLKDEAPRVRRYLLSKRDEADPDAMARETIASLSTMANRLANLPPRTKPLSTSDRARIANTLRRLADFLDEERNREMHRYTSPRKVEIVLTDDKKAEQPDD